MFDFKENFNTSLIQSLIRIFIKSFKREKKSFHHAGKYNGAHITGSKQGYFDDAFDNLKEGS